MDDRHADTAGVPFAGRHVPREPRRGRRRLGARAADRGAPPASARASSASRRSSTRCTRARLLIPLRRRARRRGRRRARAARRQDAGAVDRHRRRPRRPDGAAGLHLGRRDARLEPDGAPDPGRGAPRSRWRPPPRARRSSCSTPDPTTEFACARPAFRALATGAAWTPALRRPRGRRRLRRLGRRRSPPCGRSRLAPGDPGCAARRRRAASSQLHARRAGARPAALDARARTPAAALGRRPACIADARRLDRAASTLESR